MMKKKTQMTKSSRRYQPMTASLTRRPSKTSLMQYFLKLLLNLTPLQKVLIPNLSTLLGLHQRSQLCGYYKTNRHAPSSYLQSQCQYPARK